VAGDKGWAIGQTRSDVLLSKVGAQPCHCCEGGKTTGCRCMTDRVRIIKQEAVPDCGSFEVRFPDGRPSQYFYWDDVPSRRLRPDMLDRETALEQAKAVARAAKG
jgi:hypothetical protein